MVSKSKIIEYEKEIERLKILIDEFESPDEKIDEAPENELDQEIYSSHDRECELMKITKVLI